MDTRKMWPEGASQKSRLGLRLKNFKSTGKCVVGSPQTALTPLSLAAHFDRFTSVCEDMCRTVTRSRCYRASTGRYNCRVCSCICLQTVQRVQYVCVAGGHGLIGDAAAADTGTSSSSEEASSPGVQQASAAVPYCPGATWLWLAACVGALWT